MDAIIMDHGVIQPENKPLRRRRRQYKLASLEPEQHKKWEESIDEVITIVRENRLNLPKNPEPQPEIQQQTFPETIKAQTKPVSKKINRRIVAKRKRRRLGSLILGIAYALFTGLWVFLSLSVFGLNLHILVKFATLIFCGFTVWLNFSFACSRLYRAAGRR